MTVKEGKLFDMMDAGPGDQPLGDVPGYEMARGTKTNGA